MSKNLQEEFSVYEGLFVKEIFLKSNEEGINKVLFCFHDWFHYHSQFDYLIEFLNNHFSENLKIIVIDFPGHGRTPGTRGEFKDKNILIENLDKFIEEKSLKKNYFLSCGIGCLLIPFLRNEIIPKSHLFFVSPVFNMSPFMSEIYANIPSILFNYGKQMRMKIPHLEKIYTHSADYIKFKNDPLNLEFITINTFNMLEKLAKKVLTESYYQEGEVTLVYDESSPFVCSSSINLFLKTMPKDLSISKTYSNIGHSIISQSVSDEIFKDVLKWLK